MNFEEKVNKVKTLFEQQKQILSNLTIQNYFDSAIKIRSLELQKEIIKAIPKIKPAN